jgi:hypothetical protein
MASIWRAACAESTRVPATGVGERNSVTGISSPSRAKTV